MKSKNRQDEQARHQAGPWRAFTSYLTASEDYESYDDETLISLIARAHEKALAQLYDRYNRLVFSLASAIVGDRATAEEITLDVFMRVWQKAETYRTDQAKVSTWLTHVTRHHAIDIVRRRTVRLDQYALSWDQIKPSAIPSEQDTQESVEILARRERIRAAIAQLPEDQKRVIGMAYFGGLTQREIAEAFGQPLGTIKTRLRLAIHKLRDLLRDEQDAQDKSIRATAAYNISKDE